MSWPVFPLGFLGGANRSASLYGRQPPTTLDLLLVAGGGQGTARGGGGGGGGVTLTSVSHQPVCRVDVGSQHTGFTPTNSSTNGNSVSRFYGGSNTLLAIAYPGARHNVNSAAGGRSYSVATSTEYLGGGGWFIGNNYAKYVGGGGAGYQTEGSWAYQEGAVSNWHGGNGGYGYTLSSDHQAVLGVSVVGSGGAGAQGGSDSGWCCYAYDGSPGPGGGYANSAATTYGGGGGGNSGEGASGVVVVSYTGTRAGDGGESVIEYNGKTFHIFTSSGILQL